jgi:acylphosphatase
MTRKQLLLLLGLFLGNLTICALLVFLIQSNRPLTSAELAATVAALPTHTPTPTPTSTPWPTPVPATESSLLCQRQAGDALFNLGLAGSVHVAPNGRLDVYIHGRAPAVDRFAHAQEEVWTAFEIVLALQDQGCGTFEQMQVAVLDTRWNPPRARVKVQAQLDDLIAWKQGRIIDAELMARLQVESPGD